MWGVLSKVHDISGRSRKDIMGLDVSAAKAVSINDHHENGVNTSIEANPTRSRNGGTLLIHVFSRNGNGSRRDDGNPLIHAMKSRRGFTITAHWRSQVMRRARAILAKVGEDLEGFDYVMPVPSSSEFCAAFASEVAAAAQVPLLDPGFMRKATVGEVLARLAASPPKVRPGLKVTYTSQLHAWQRMDGSAEYQAKEIDVKIRHLVEPFVVHGEPPSLQGKRVLIADDLVASGTSIRSARTLLHGRGAQVSGITFLSGA